MYILLAVIVGILIGHFIWRLIKPTQIGTLHIFVAKNDKIGPPKITMYLECNDYISNILDGENVQMTVRWNEENESNETYAEKIKKRNR